MTTLADFRGRVKSALGIKPSVTSTEKGFEDDNLDNHIRQSVEEFSLYVPVEATANVAVSGGSRSFALSALTRPIGVAAVEYPLGQWPRALLDFDVFGGTVTLDHGPPSGGYTVAVYYTQQHLVDGSGSTIEPEHEHVIVEGAAAQAGLARAVQAASYAEAALTNPVTFQHLRPAQQRLERWREHLRALGSGRLRRRQSYSPSTAPASRSIVGWPS